MKIESTIFLIRHCKPNIDYSSCDYQEAACREGEYNRTENIKTEEILPLADRVEPILNNKDSIIFASTRPRATITAKKLFASRREEIIFDDKFIEFDLKILPLPWVKMSFNAWATISRILWFLRLLPSERSVSYELTRAKECAEILYDKAKSGAPVVLVAHGILNKSIEKHLKPKGYKRISKVKNGFFSITKLSLS
jgi:broad specificity phosphatase PhoE